MLLGALSLLFFLPGTLAINTYQSAKAVDDSIKDISISHQIFRLAHTFHYDARRTLKGLQALDVRDPDDLFSCYKLKKRPALANFTLKARFEYETPRLPRGNTANQQPLQPEDPLMLHPNISDKETIVNLAKMTSDAYLIDPREPSWLNTTFGLDFTCSIGWDESGLRGHIFATEDNSTIVVAFKGTTINPIDKISGHDRINDVKLFSCCCGAQNPYRYRPVCDCATGYNQCDGGCMVNSLLQNDSYYNTAMLRLDWVRHRYPDSRLWVVGHSLGGALASLVGLTNNIPAVTFEAPPERLAAERIGAGATSGAPRRDTSIYHFGNTGDPVFTGECNGIASLCSFWGFSFESKCFTGRRCVYDTRKDKGWRLSVANHRIVPMIKDVLEAYETVPECVSDVECRDCEDWTFD